MSNVTNKLFVEQLGGRTVQEFNSKVGDIFYDPNVGDLRISDGRPGGRPLITQLIGSYRGFQAGCNQFLNGSDTNVVQVIIHNAEAKVDYINFTDDTNNDDFYATSLSDMTTDSNRATKIMAVNLYSAPNSNRDTRLSVENVRAFVRKFIDTVLYDDQDSAIDNVDIAKELFYNNIDTLVQSLPNDTLFKDFTFDDGGRYFYPEYNGPRGNATAQLRGWIWPSYAGPNYSDNAEVIFGNAGTGYEIGDQIVIEGQQMYGVTGDNDLTLTVQSLKSGNITEITMTSGGDGFYPHTSPWNWSNLSGGEDGGGAAIRIKTCTTAGEIVEWEMAQDGSDYLVGDTLTLNFGGADATFEVVSVGTNGIQNYSVSGTTYLGSPYRVPYGYWPKFSIDDGSYNQYDDGNYLSTDESTSTYTADFTGFKMTLTGNLKSGVTLQPGMRGVVPDQYNPTNVNSFRLVSQSDDNSDVWYIDSNGISQSGAKVRFDSISYNSGSTAGETQEFGGGNYVVVFDQGIFALMSFYANINSIYYNGETGVNGNGYKEVATVMGAKGDDFASKEIPQNYTYNNSYTLVSSDAGRHIYYNDGGSNTVRIPNEADVSFPIGTAITIVSGDDGWCYIRAVDGTTTSVYGAGYNQTSNAFYIPENSMATILKVATDKWILSGAGLGID